MKSIKTKIIILIVLSTITVTSVVGILLVQKTRTTFENETIDKLEQTVLRYSNEINSEVNLVEELAREVELLVSAMFNPDELKNNPNYLDELEEDIAPTIKTIAESGKFTNSAYVFFSPELDKKAHDVWFSDLNYDGITNRQEEFPIEYYDEFSPGKEWFFIPYETGKAYWTDPYAGNADYDAHIIYMSYTKPIYVNDILVGVVGSDYHFNLLKDRLSEIVVYKTGYASLLNENAEILIHPTLEQLTSLRDVNSGEYSWMADEIINNDFGIIEYKWIDGKDKIMVYSKLDNGWILALSPEKKEVFKWIDNLTTVIIIIMVIGILIVSVIGYKFGVVITNPLNSLSSSVKLIGDGDYNTEIPEALLLRSDETGVLANSIESMRKLQKNTFDEISKNNETLEERVVERTESLIRTNEYLEMALGENEEQTAELTILNSQLETTLENMIETQKLLIESEKMAALSYLVTGIAHEINTPVGNLLTLLTFLQRKKKELMLLLDSNKLGKTDFLKFMNLLDESYDLIFANINKTTLLVNKFKELDPYSSVSKETTVNLSDYIDIVIDSIPLTPENYSYAVEVICDKNLFVKIDSGKFSQIIIQLIENAFFHAFANCDDGIVLIEVEVIDRHLSLIVRDNGVGMSENGLKQIFLPFYSSAFSGKKSGLGLNIVYNIVTKIFKGSITCDSSIGEGTNFYIDIYLNDN